MIKLFQRVTMADMTTARRYHGTIDERDARMSDIIDKAIRDYNKSRRRRGLRMISQEAIASEVFGRNADWLSKRLLGQNAFTTAEVIDICNFVSGNVFTWIEDAKHGGDDGPSAGDAGEFHVVDETDTDGSSGGSDSSVQYLRENLTILTGVRDGEHHIGQLRIAS